MEDAPWPYTAGTPWRAVDGQGTVAYSFAVRDLTGDGLPDLLLTLDASAPSVGRDAWSVYVSDGAGFAATPTAWALPPLEGDDWSGASPWPATDGEASRTVGDGESTYLWALVDLTGDRLEDLLLTRDELDPTIGESWWNAYPSDGAGFATDPTQWTLPPLDGEAWWAGVPWPKTSDNRSRMTESGEEFYSWGLIDLTADGAADLVLTNDGASATVGTSGWYVFPAHDSGFGTTAALWELPGRDVQAYDEGSPWPYIGGRSFYDVGGNLVEYYWNTFDLTGDGLPELVFTSDEADGDLGKTHWAVTSGTCAGGF